MEIKITKKEALKIANRIGQKFGVYGYGHLIFLSTNMRIF